MMKVVSTELSNVEINVSGTLLGRMSKVYFLQSGGIFDGVSEEHCSGKVS
jgi:hypothetical protein